MERLTHRRLASIAGYLILAIFTFVLYISGLVESSGLNLIVAAIVALWIAGVGFESFREWRSAYSAESKEQRFDFPTDTMSFLYVFLGAVVTYAISIDLGQGAVVASGLIGIFGAAFLKPYAVPIYCGSFVGMASPALLDYSGLMLAAVIAGAIFVLAKHVFNGFGGKLGTIAFTGCVLSALIVGKPLLSGPVPSWDTGWMLVAYCAAAALITFVLSIWFGQGPVMASGMVGLAGGLLLPAIHGPEVGSLLAIGVFSASFAGMSGTSRFEKAKLMIPAGILCALIIMYTAPYMGGAGGKLGTTAFGAVIGIRGLMVIAMNVQCVLGLRTDDNPVPNS
jgi:hypothetical protein